MKKYRIINGNGSIVANLLIFNSPDIEPIWQKYWTLGFRVMRRY